MGQGVCQALQGKRGASSLPGTSNVSVAEGSEQNWAKTPFGRGVLKPVLLKSPGVAVSKGIESEGLKGGFC